VSVFYTIWSIGTDWAIGMGSLPSSPALLSFVFCFVIYGSPWKLMSFDISLAILGFSPSKYKIISHLSTDWRVFYSGIIFLLHFSIISSRVIAKFNYLGFRELWIFFVFCCIILFGNYLCEDPPNGSWALLFDYESFSWLFAFYLDLVRLDQGLSFDDIYVCYDVNLFVHILYHWCIW